MSADLMHALVLIEGTGKNRRVTTGCGLNRPAEGRTAIETTAWSRDVTCEVCRARTCPNCKAGVKHVH